MPTVPFEIEVDAERNFVRVRYSGKVTAADTKTAVEKVGATMSRVKPGFSILVDLSGLDSMALECAPHLSKMMELCKEAGVRRTVRVIPDPSKDIGWNILSVIHYRGKVQIVTCETLAEAEKVLRLG